MLKKLEIKNKSVKDLKELILKLRKEMFNIRFQVTSGQFENLGKLKFIRKNIARIKTELNAIKVTGVSE